MARRLGVSAETVAPIARNQAAEAKAVDPNPVITAVEIAELSLKKRHKLQDVTILTDLSDPDKPCVLAVIKDGATARECLGQLAEEQRRGVRAQREGMGRRLSPPARCCCSTVRRSSIACTRPRNSTRRPMRGENTIRRHKAELTKKERKEFWALL